MGASFVYRSKRNSSYFLVQLALPWDFGGVGGGIKKICGSRLSKICFDITLILSAGILQYILKHSHALSIHLWLTTAKHTDSQYLPRLELGWQKTNMLNLCNTSYIIILWECSCDPASKARAKAFSLFPDIFFAFQCDWSFRIFNLGLTITCIWTVKSIMLKKNITTYLSVIMWQEVVLKKGAMKDFIDRKSVV